MVQQPIVIQSREAGTRRSRAVSWLSLGFTLMGVVITSGCGTDSDEHIVTGAHNAYQIMSVRYRDIITSTDDAELIKKARGFGVTASVGGWSGLWSEFLGNDHLTRIQGAPLHRTEYFLNEDIADINRHLSRLESRVLTSLPLYQKLIDLRYELHQALAILQQSEAYTEESRFLGDRALQKAVLYETQRQREALEDIADRPVVIEKTEVIRTKKSSSGERKDKRVKTRETVSTSDIPENPHVIV